MQSNKIERYTNEEMEAIFDEFVKSKAKDVEKMSIEHPIGDRSRKEGLEIIYRVDGNEYIFEYGNYSIVMSARNKSNISFSVYELCKFEEALKILHLPVLESMEKQYEVISEYINQ